MTKQEILSELAKSSTVEKMIAAYSKGQADYASDLAQDIYLNLMEKDEQLLIDLYNKNQIGFYVLRMVRNNLFSSTSPYYTKYIKYDLKNTDITANEYKLQAE